MARLGGLEGWRLRVRRRRLRRGKSARGSRGRPALLVSLVVLGAATVASFVYLEPDPPGREQSLTTMVRLAEGSDVRAVTILDEDSVVVATSGTAGTVWARYPRNDATAPRLIQAFTATGVEVTVDPQTSKSVVRTVVTVLLPLMILANLFALFFVSSRGGPSTLGEVVTFGRIRRGRGVTGRSTTTFADVAGLDEAVDELREVVDYLARPERYRAMNAAPPKGVMLFGPPGCGKTLLARSIAGEAQVPFFAVAGAEFVESLVGVGAARVRDLFATVRAVAPAIVFIDELDAAGRRRGGVGGSGGSDERDQTLNQLLVEMDGFDASSGIVVVAATNRPDILDPALLRPGRFDRLVTVDKPDVERRQAILRLHASKMPVAEGVDFELLARQTPGFSGADLANVVNEAALLAIRREERELSARTFSDAVQRVRSGPQRGTLLTPAETRRLAAHEAGRAVLLLAAGRGDEVHRLSVVTAASRQPMPLEREEEGRVQTAAQLHDRITACFGGRAGEEVVVGTASTLGEHDIARATELAYDLVTRYGMSDAVGPRVVVPAGFDMPAQAAVTMLSPEAQAAVDAEVADVLRAAHRRAVAIVSGIRSDLLNLVDVLVELETLEGEELDELLPRPVESPSTVVAHRSKPTPRRQVAEQP